MEDKEHKRRMILKLIQKAGIDIDSLPSTAVHAFREIPYKTLVKSLVLEDREKGLTFGQLSIKYKLSIRQIKFICSSI